MDAKVLFQEGVVAIRDQKDAAKGRELLMQSLKIEPKNEMAWLWLSRTMAEPADFRCFLCCLHRRFPDLLFNFKGTRQGHPAHHWV